MTDQEMALREMHRRMDVNLSAQDDEVVPVDQTAELEWCETHKIAWVKADHPEGCLLCRLRATFSNDVLPIEPQKGDIVAVRAEVDFVGDEMGDGQTCETGYKLHLLSIAPWRRNVFIWVRRSSIISIVRRATE